MKNILEKIKGFIKKNTERIPSIYLILIVILVLYGFFVVYDMHSKENGSLPVIEVPEEELVLSVSHTEPDLLKGVRATDKEDGDISSKVFVENISEFDEQGKRTITYAVFDDDDQIAYASRKLRYTDYEGPKMYLKMPLLSYGPQFENIVNKYIRVYSELDGDISSQAVMEDFEDEDQNHYLIFSVKDSCGAEQTLKLKMDQVKSAPNINIKLTDYLIYVEKGTEIDPVEYIDNIQLMGVDYKEGYDLVKIQTDYNPDKKGIYEFFYTIKEKNGDYGITKLVVVVE